MRIHLLVAVIVLTLGNASPLHAGDKVHTLNKGEWFGEGKIADGDPKVMFAMDQKEVSFPGKQYLVKLAGGKTYRITMRSVDVPPINCVLVIMDDAGKQLAWNWHYQNKKGTGPLNAQITLPAPRDGTYKISTLAETGLGAFTVQITEEKRLNTLIEQEIAEGWILLFDGATGFGWTLGKSTKAENDEIAINADFASVTTAFGSLEMEFEYRVKKAFAGIKENDAYLQIGSLKKTLIRRAANNVWYTAKFTIDRNAPGWTVAGSYFQTLQKKEKIGLSPFAQLPPTKIDQSGPVTFKFGTDKSSTLFLRNVKVRPKNRTSLFNGKDLTGWQEVPGKKSKYCVTDKGEINVKDGPGDLQTTSEWDDFVLQLDVFSNGKHLNSGVFFRCLHGQFWSGYEAQIRNQWEGDDRGKPVDYGTGGIYNLQAARKVVSNDKEWFTMTIVAHGNHLATWVNGYQVTDFTDTRAEKPSARNGLKLGKGPISLQGHDPTTDLSFRNIRIESIPKEPGTK